MEVAGAALATVIGQIVAALLALWFHRRKNHELHISLRKYGVSGKVIRTIYSVGSSFYYYGLYWFSDDVWYEQNSHGIYIHCNSGIRCIL